ncbi:MAG: RNA 2',3'-cyclic phosphodiesterase, partial [Clostridiales bacterium]|nr:RNA 2',3'-cyclic phosphodiesterase [Clostridiales bacterium]
MRTFIAIDFDDEIKDNIANLQNEIKKDCKRGNFTTRENLHLTMHFLGEIESDDLEYVMAAMDETAAANRKFEFNFEKIGYFDRGNKCILWLGAEKSRPLTRLYETLEKNLGKQGFKRERAAFTPHITIAREAELYYNKRIIVDKFKPDFEPFIVNEISLMESKRIGSKPVYKKLYT